MRAGSGAVDPPGFGLGHSAVRVLDNLIFLGFVSAIALDLGLFCPGNGVSAPDREE